LKLLNLKENDLQRITGLLKQKNLKELYLSANKIGHISGLETLINLETLDLNNNNIKKISGLEALMSLNSFWIRENQVPENVLEKLGGIDSSGFANDPIKFVEYCLINISQ
jgi:Leucine-rich repeat (LRR) protein